MDIISIMSSLNKISLLAFTITLLFLLYQIYIIKNELSKKRGKPVIPDFNENEIIKRKTNLVIVKHNKPLLFKQRNTLYITVILVFLVIFLSVFAISALFQISSQKKNTNVITPNTEIDFVASKGIRVYNDKWKELSEQDMQNLTLNEELIIGIETVEQADIDMARIRINENVWKSEHVTTQYNKAKRVFFVEYTISSKSALLKINAQLHSKNDGWLGQ